MQPTLCSRCKKNVAVVFISRMNEKNEMVNEGLCLKCAKSLGLPQVNDMMQRMGITDEDLDNLNNEMMQAMDSIENVEDLPGGEDDEDSWQLHHDNDCDCGCEHDHHEHHHHHDGGECDDPECECHHHHHHADEVFTSWGVETPKAFTMDELKADLAALDDGEKYGAVLRAKGIVKGEGCWIHFDYVPGESNIRTGSASVMGRLCVIGTKLNEHELSELFGV